MTLRREEDKIGRAPAATPGSPAYRPHGPRRRESSKVRFLASSRGISAAPGAGPMSGRFTKVETPASLVAGEMIKATIGYEAEYPGAGEWEHFFDWSTCIMVALGPPEEPMRPILIVSDTKETSDEGGGEHTYDIAKMPKADAPLEFRLFGHDDPNHEWTVEDWAEAEAPA